MLVSEEGHDASRNQGSAQVEGCVLKVLRVQSFFMSMGVLGGLCFLSERLQV